MRYSQGAGRRRGYRVQSTEEFLINNREEGFGDNCVTFTTKKPARKRDQV